VSYLSERIVNSQDVITELSALKKKFTEIKSQLEAAEKEKPPDEGFISVLSPFYTENI
jgi:hypothetical protein